MRQRTGFLKDERGVSLAFVAISMVVVLGFAALAIDVGMLYTAKGQAQNAADSGALAGAGNLLVNPNDAVDATNVAVSFTNTHSVVNEPVAVGAADVAVTLDDSACPAVSPAPGPCVTVTVNHTVPTFFARVLGFDTVAIQADATAQVGPANQTSCLKPWIIPDGYQEFVNPPGEFNPGDYYQKGVTSYGTNFRGPSQDWGLQLTLKVGNPQATPAPGQFYPIDLPLPGEPDTGGSRYSENIYSCNALPVQVGDLVWTETGNMVGPTRQGVQELINKDPLASWDSTYGIVGSSFAAGGSPRLVLVPMFDPGNPPTAGKQQLEVVNIAGFFVDYMNDDEVTGHLMPGMGVGSGTGAMLQSVRLVE